mmetsp:Transcript_20704/g.53814  ORF Transcript_20704/g.53814 Transcript_20704/m.53814 type:complete len:685 (-) Transcript_20704:443-2497(-)
MRFATMVACNNRWYRRMMLRCFLLCCAVRPAAMGRPTTAEDTAFEMTVCDCDLSGGLCDLNCCCDPDCGCTDLSSFTVDCRCTNAGTTGFRYACGAQIASSAHSGPVQDLLGLLCVEHEGHQPHQGLFFPPINLSASGASLSSALTNSDRLRFTYPDGAATAAEVVESTPALYTVGATLVTYANNSISTQSAGTLSQPSGVLGRCSDFNPALFLVDESESLCVRAPADAEAGCVVGGALDIRTYAATAVGTYLLQEDGAVSSRVAIDNVTVVVLVDGTQVAVSRTLTDPPLDLSAFSASLVGGTCTNAAVSVNRSFVWDGQAVVQLVTWVTLGNVSTATSVTQSFASNFRSTAIPNSDPSVQFEFGVNQSRSGNPGYLVGKPMVATVLAGYEGGQAAANQTYGTPTGPTSTNLLTMLGATATGGCPAGEMLVQFGVDQVSGCVLSISASHTCTQIRAAAAAAVDVGLNRVAAIREYGTSRNGTTNFVTVLVDEVATGDVDSNTTAHDAGLAQLFPDMYCTGVLTEANLEVLVAETGEEGWPQRRVLSAKLTRVYSTVKIGCDGHTTSPANFSDLTVGCASSGVGASLVTLYQSARYLTVPQVAFRYKGDLLPPPFREQPFRGCRYTTCYDEIFYPFLTQYNTTASVDLEYQRAKAYGIAIFTATAVGSAVALSAWAQTGSNFRK